MRYLLGVHCIPGIVLGPVDIAGNVGTDKTKEITSIHCKLSCSRIVQHYKGI